MALIKTKGTARKIYNPYCLLITPFVKNEDGDLELGDVTYNVEEVVQDTTAITQGENTENAVNNEFSSSPIANNVQVGSYTFACEVGDMQGVLLRDLAGFEVDPISGKVYAPSGYVEKFAKIDLVFNAGAKYYAATLPKVQLGSIVQINSMSSSIGRISINGTGYNLEMTDGANTYDTPFIMNFDFTLPT